MEEDLVRIGDPPKLCSACAGINLDALSKPNGYTLVAKQIQKSHCPMCKFICAELRFYGNSGAEQEPTIIQCSLLQQEGCATALRIESTWPPKKGILHMYIWYADEDNFLKTLQYGLAVRLNLGEHALSQKTLNTLSVWFEDCNSTHNCGRPLSKNPNVASNSDNSITRSRNPLNATPTRLIQLDAHGGDTWDCKLVDFEEGMEYAALSYCWGRTQNKSYTTTKETIESRRTRIVFEDLPDMLGCGVAIARVLTLRYLWIDAICIVQDSKEDWDRESVLMGGIYSNAYVTLSADIGSSTDDGCILRPAQEDEVTGAVRIPMALEHGDVGALYFYRAAHVEAPYWTSPEPIRQSTLSTRGWCFQERMLSKRILHFTDQGVYWECRERYRCEDNVLLFDAESICKTFPSTINIFEHGVSRHLIEMQVGISTNPDQLRDSWENTDGSEPGSEAYSRPPHVPPRRKLTKADLAHACLCGMVQGLRMTGTMNNELSKEQKHFIMWWNKNIVQEFSKRSFTYQTDRLPALSGLARLFGQHIQASYVAGLWLDELEDGLDWRRAGAPYQAHGLDYPTFSWAAYPGPVHWPYRGNMRPYGSAFSLWKHHVELATSDSFGQVVSASLTLVGHIGIVDCRIAEKPDPQADTVEGILLDDESETIGDVELDFPEHPEEMYCFWLYKNSLGFLRVLLLKGVDGETKQYQRIGVGQIHPDFADQWVERNQLRRIDLV